jgi:cytochrome c2
MSERSWFREYSRRLARIAMVTGLSVLFGMGSAVAADQTKEPDLEMGARLVDARCVFCHKQESLPKLVERCTDEHGEAYLDDFLKRHHAPDDEARADIIAYLTCLEPLLPPE